MSNLTQFDFEGNNVRIRVVNGEPWFCLIDICDILEIENNRNVVSRLKGEGVRNMDTLTNGGKQVTIFINEPNLYRVIFQSRKPNAERFQDWVFEEVLPSIRKTGKYEVKEPKLELDDEAKEVQRIANMGAIALNIKPSPMSQWRSCRNILELAFPHIFLTANFVQAVGSKATKRYQKLYKKDLPMKSFDTGHAKMYPPEFFKDVILMAIEKMQSEQEVEYLMNKNKD